METKKTKYINPYLGGFFLGLVLLSAYYVGGHGLGSSGAIKNTVIALSNKFLPSITKGNEYFTLSEAFLHSWVFIMFLGLIVGGFISGAVSGRLKFEVERGPRISATMRLTFALLGGALFGFGAQLGRGCTSGAALSGMAVLSASGIITMMAIFGTGYAIAFIFRRLWV